MTSKKGKKLEEKKEDNLKKMTNSKDDLKKIKNEDDLKKN